MKLVLSLAFVGLLCAPVATFAQDGNVVVNTGNAINCVTERGEQGFAAKTWTIGGTVTGGFASGDHIGQASAPSLHDLVITKTFDACSHQLIHAFLLGSATAIPKLTLIQYSAAKEASAPVALITITLTDALINVYTVSGAPNVNPVETLDFTYKKMCISSISQRPDGTENPPVTACYDVSQNKLS